MCFKKIDGSIHNGCEINVIKTLIMENNGIQSGRPISTTDLHINLIGIGKKLCVGWGGVMCVWYWGC